MDSPVSTNPAAPVPAGTRRRDVPVVVLEVLGYAGASAALAASSIAVGDLSSESTQVVTSLVTAAVLLVAGWFVGDTDRDAFHRMRSVFWFLGLLSWVSATVVVLTQVVESLDARWVVSLTGLVGSMLALPLWWIERRSLQFIGLFVSLHVTLAALVYAEKTESIFGFGQTVPNTLWIALVTMAFGVGGIALGWRGAVAPRRTAMVVGSIALIVGSLFVDLDLIGGGFTTFALILALAAAVAVLGIGGATSERAPSGVGIAGILLLVSGLVDKEIAEQGPAIAVLVIGLVLVGATIALAPVRRGAAPTLILPSPSAPVPSAPPPPGSQASAPEPDGDDGSS